MRSILLSFLLCSSLAVTTWHTSHADDLLEDVLELDEGMPNIEDEAGVPPDSVPMAPAPPAPVTPSTTTAPDANAVEESPLQSPAILQLSEQPAPLIANPKVSAHFKRSDEEINKIIVTTNSIRKLHQNLHELVRALDERLDSFFAQTATDVGQLKKSITPSAQTEEKALNKEPQ
ncbi:MAG: hypothetical protein H6679_05420 [Epsilonproteobacteria bacterium]|nr:hypothetical protein [Campylobacterota bacterium]